MSAAIDEQRIVNLLSDLVAIPSVNPVYRKEGEPEGHYGEARVAEFIADTLRRLGLDVEVVPVLPGRPNVIARLEGRSRKGGILFQTHMDTVHAGGMSVDPFRAAVRDGRLYGRGAVDAKAQLAVMMEALRLLAGPQRPECDVTFVAAVDEEYNYRGVSHMIRSGLRADGGVVGEPTALRVVRACKGCVRWETHILGRAAHSSRPHEGENAIAVAADFLGYLRSEVEPELRARVHPLVGPPTLTPTMISGGAGPNIVPDRCVVVFDRRVPPHETPEAALAEFEAAVQRYCSRTGARIEVRPPFTRDIPMEVPESERIVSIARRATEKILGYDSAIGVTFSCDATKMTEAGIPTVVFGPGDIAQAHAADEHVEIKQLGAAVRVLVEIARTFPA